MGNETNLRADRNQYLRQPLQDTISKVIALGWWCVGVVAV